MTEAKALRALKNGDTAALEWFIDRYTPYLAAIVNNIIGTGRGDDAEEIISDVFFALWQNPGRIRSGTAKSYLGRIARNKAVDFLRSSGEETLPLEEDAVMLSTPGPEEAVEQVCDRFAVQEAVLAMQWPQREIFIRHYFYFQPLADIAAALDMPVNTVKTHLRRGRERLRRALEEEICV